MEEDLESRSTAPSDTGARTAATAPRSGSDTDSSSSTLAYDKHFICSAPGLLTLTELVSVNSHLHFHCGLAGWLQGRTCKGTQQTISPQK